MTFKALKELENLKKKSNLKVIPVTTRSVAQFKRVNPMQNCEFAITSNGRTILHNGMVFNLWKDRISSILEKYQKDFNLPFDLIKDIRPCDDINKQCSFECPCFGHCDKEEN